MMLNDLFYMSSLFFFLSLSDEFNNCMEQVLSDARIMIGLYATNID